MYNGIGLQTARGSGTNGHVQRNFAFVRAGKKDNMSYRTEGDLKKMDALNNRPPNLEILEHERKRKIEVKCMEFEEILEDQNYTADEIATKIQSFREKLTNQKKDDLPKDEFGRFAARETHQVAAAQQEKNERLRSAFGISEYFVEGTSFDADRKGKEELAKSTALQGELEAQRAAEKEKGKLYKLVRTPPRETEAEPEIEKKASKPSKKKDSADKKKSSKDKKKKKNNRSHKRKKADSSDSSSSSSSSSSDSSSDSESDEKSKKHKSSKRNDAKTVTKKNKESHKSKKDHKRTSSDSDKKKPKDKRNRKRKHSDSEATSSSSDSSSSDDNRKHKRK